MHNEKHPELGCFGDDDPIDVVEIGASALEAGSVTPVKPLGVLAMIDDGELDWKVIAVATSDPLASKLNDIGDVEKECPGWSRASASGSGGTRRPTTSRSTPGFDEAALSRPRPSRSSPRRTPPGRAAATAPSTRASLDGQVGAPLFETLGVVSSRFNRSPFTAPPRRSVPEAERSGGARV